MKRHPKVRWYPYLMLGLGVAFLVLAVAQLFISKTPGPSYLTGFAWGIYGTNGIGRGFAMFLLVGTLLTTIGAYALRHHKE